MVGPALSRCCPHHIQADAAKQELAAPCHTPELPDAQLFMSHLMTTGSSPRTPGGPPPQLSGREGIERGSERWAVGLLQQGA